MRTLSHLRGMPKIRSTLAKTSETMRETTVARVHDAVSEQREAILNFPPRARFSGKGPSRIKLLPARHAPAESPHSGWHVRAHQSREMVPFQLSFFERDKK